MPDTIQEWIAERNIVPSQELNVEALIVAIDTLMGFAISHNAPAEVYCAIRALAKTIEKEKLND